MKNFKILVTPKESEVLQKLLFIAGYKWCDGTTDVFISNECLLFDDLDETHGHKTLSVCSISQYDLFPNYEITFEEFINEIELELNEKFQN
jgi:hypothetical protein